MRTEIAKLHKRLNATVIYVTHDQIEAMTMGTRIVIMKDSEIQQIDSPQNAYDHPVNLFVAQFIGSPQMNIFRGKVIDDKGIVEIVLPDGTTLGTSSEKAGVLKDRGYINKEVYVGIRPENLHESESDPLQEEYSVMSGQVEVSELMGSETYLYLTKCSTLLRARVPSKSKKKVGDNVEFQIHWNRIHMFDVESEIAIR
jgi:multiple sugar transport system ATP-binding protein